MLLTAGLIAPFGLPALLRLVSKMLPENCLETLGRR